MATELQPLPSTVGGSLEATVQATGRAVHARGCCAGCCSPLWRPLHLRLAGTTLQIDQAQLPLNEGCNVTPVPTEQLIDPSWLWPWPQPAPPGPAIRLLVPPRQEWLLCAATETERNAWLVALEDAIAHVRLEDVSRPQNTLLFLLSTAAGELNDYSIFSTLTVRAMMQFKWHSYASYIFKLQFFGYLLLLGFVSVASFGLPRLCEDARTIEVCPVHLRDDEEEGYGAVPNRAR